MSTNSDISILNSDSNFNSQLPEYLRPIAGIQFTPFQVALKAADFLAQQPRSKVLDIGSGTGKFCLLAASRYPDSEFIGIEQRKDLFEYSRQLSSKLSLNNVQFKLGDVLRHNLRQYTGFYFYNSFHENLVYGNSNNLEEGDDPAFDSGQYEEADFSTNRFIEYSETLRCKLNKCADGTKLVTYHSLGLEVPNSFELVDQQINDKLSFWIQKV